MTAGAGIFGSGRLLAWQALSIVGSIPCVAIPAAIQGAASMRIGPDREPLTLGSLSLMATVALYFFVIAMVNGVLVARAMGAHWMVASLVGLAAACGLCVTTGMFMYEMAEIGGPIPVMIAWAGLIAMLVLNLGAPRWSGSGDADSPIVRSTEFGL